MKTRKLLKCPICYQKGIKKGHTLCQVIAPGIVSIRREKTLTEDNFTVIKGKNFEVICGRCGETIYFV